jgi:Ca-activated chloride channel homolog
VPRGSHAKGGLRSHRRRLGKHLIIAPWVIITAVCVLVFAGLTTTYVVLITSGCNDPTTTATVLVDPDVSDVVSKLGRTWTNDRHTVDGHCAAVSVESKDSTAVAAALSPDWNTRLEGPRPDVWIPESSLWSQLAGSRQAAARMLPASHPSLARSPIVVAMPRPMANAIGGATPSWTWHDLVTTYAGTSWAAHGHPAWGGFQFAMTSPTVSTAGLGALTAIADANDDGMVTAAEQSTLNHLWQVKSDYTTETDTILQRLLTNDETSSSRALATVSAFPALEQEVADYNTGTPRVPLEAVYPSDGTPQADFPYLTIKWSHADTPQIDTTAQRHRDHVAAAFLSYLKSDDARSQFLAAGYRAPDGAPGTGLTAPNGVRRAAPKARQTMMTTGSLSHTVSAWTAISQPTNVLILMDTSGAMGQTADGTGGKSRLQVAGSAAADAVSLFGSQARIGLWAYASNLNGDQDYEEIVPLGKVNSDMGGLTRGATVRSNLTNLFPGGDAGLYSTVSAAYQTMRDHYVNGATNEIVLITSGKDTAGDTSLSQLTATITKNQDKHHPLPIMTVAYGNHIDLPSLQAISTASGGRPYPTDSATELPNLLLTAMFSGNPLS